VTPILKNGKTAIPDAAIESIRKNKVALKGPLAVCTNSLHILLTSSFYPPPLFSPLFMRLTLTNLLP
jgi:hypothetical protein